MKLGLLSALCACVSFAAYHFVGVLNLGVGEPSANYEDVSLGYLANAPPIAVGVPEAPQNTSGPLTLVLEDRRFKIKTGEMVQFGDYDIRLTDIHVAPMFSLQAADGALVDFAYIKLKLSDPPDDFFQLGILPYKFYVTHSNALKGTFFHTPAKLHVRVVRGKIILLESEMENEQPLSFEGFTLKYSKGAPWVTLRISRKNENKLLWISAVVLILLGAFMRMGFTAKHAVSLSPPYEGGG